MTGKLFLTETVWRTFELESDKIVEATLYNFSTEGTVKVRKEVFVPAHFVESLERHMDVSANWEPLPDFGFYQSISRIER